MERFREHEKEFKMKQYSKRALQADYERQGNFVSQSDEESGIQYSNSSGYDFSDNSENNGSDEEIDEIASYEDDSEEERLRRDSMADEDEEDNQKQLAKDKNWLENFINDKLKKAITKIEHEVDNIRNKKVRGAVKKQKDMLKQLNDKLKLMRNTRIKCEELAMTIGFLEGGDIRQLKVLLKKYYEDPDQDEARESVDKEVEELVQRADQNR